MATHPTQQTIPVLVTREQDYRGNKFLTMNADHNGQSWMTECDTRDQGLAELAEAMGVPTSSLYITEAE